MIFRFIKGDERGFIIGEIANARGHLLFFFYSYNEQFIRNSKKHLPKCYKKSMFYKVTLLNEKENADVIR